jgi:ATP-binding cassette subfamily B (MDR/TAP) protein 1
VTGFGWSMFYISLGYIVDVLVKYENGNKFNITDNLSSDEFLSDIYIYSGMLFAMSVVLFICNYLIMTCFPIAAINQIHRIRIKFFESVLKQEISWHDSKSSGGLTSRITALVIDCLFLTLI